jgi:hypothetical protein
MELSKILQSKINGCNLSRTDEMRLRVITQLLNETDDGYSKWKKQNVTLRGIKVEGQDNGVWGSWGKGLYTVPLSNKAMAKQYGTVYFIVNGIPKKPKVLSGINEAEIFREKIIQDYLIKNNKQNERFGERYFYEHTSFEAEMLSLGYDGLVIKGREMVNYTPSNILYFKTEIQLKNYYESVIQNNKINESVKLNEEIYGSFITAYHQTDADRFIKGVITQKIRFGDGQAYGKGFYLTSDLESQTNMLGSYGDSVVKCIFKPNGILFFDAENQIKVFKKEMSILEQCNYWGFNLSQSQIKQIMGIDSEMLRRRDELEITSKFVNMEFERIKDCIGLSFKQPKDGNVIVMFKTDNIKISGYYPIDIDNNKLKKFKPLDIVHYRDSNVLNTPDTISKPNSVITSSDYKVYKELYDKIYKWLDGNLINLFIYAVDGSDKLYDFVNENNNGLHYKMRFGDLTWVLQIISKYSAYDNDYDIFGGIENKHQLIKRLNILENIVISSEYTKYFPYKTPSVIEQINTIKDRGLLRDMSKIKYISHTHKSIEDIIKKHESENNTVAVEWCVQQLNKIIKSKNKKIDKTELHYVKDAYDLRDFLIQVNETVKKLIDPLPYGVDIEKLKQTELLEILRRVQNTNSNFLFKILLSK